ncbi:MAG: T9SS type A sorting domain-containing protein [Saprospiraceae bacterium]|nr:T9SS type A sorting domain-containing protein [Saprospiraceae bacterium]
MKYIDRLLLSLLLVGLLQLPIFGQIFPGDADNNGRVENYDVLYTGYAFGEIGPSRLGESPEDSQEVISLLWEDIFPSGLNFAYADADGNGAIDFLDLLAISTNYGAESGVVVNSEFLEGIPGTDPAISFDRSAIPPLITENSTVEIPLFLGTPENPLQDVNGIAFNITYDAEFIAELRLDLNPAWLGRDSQLFILQGFPDAALASSGRLDVAMTRLGKQPTMAFGRIGTLSIIIEDDLIELLPDNVDQLPVAVSVVGVGVIDGDFNTIPVVEDSIHLEVMNPAAISDVIDKNKDGSVKVYPNPTQSQLNILSTDFIQEVQFYTTSGQKLKTQSVANQKKFEVPVQGLPAGPLLLKIIGNQGVITKKVWIQSP